MWFTSILSVIVWGRLCSQNPGLRWRASLSERVQAPGSWSIFRLKSKFHKISFKICNYQRNIATPFDSTSFFNFFNHNSIRQCTNFNLSQSVCFMILGPWRVIKELQISCQTNMLNSFHGHVYRYNFIVKWPHSSIFLQSLCWKSCHK